MRSPIPVIDLFAGPGGLSEGFISVRRSSGRPAFRVALSIESDHAAHSTLRLRAFFRHFPTGKAPDDYYRYLRGEIGRDALFSAHPEEARQSDREAWLAVLGKEPRANVRHRINDALNGASSWVLIGGPPCQAYSVVGRSRQARVARDVFESDSRHQLYKEYLRILADHQPPLFVMENVKGLLSSRLEGARIFEQILEDLQAPAQAVHLPGRVRYRLFSLAPSQSGAANGWSEPRATDFVIRTEEHGLPQARHRVILVGLREDLLADHAFLSQLAPMAPVPIEDAIDDLPRLRSGFSKRSDSAVDWRTLICRTLRNWRRAPQFAMPDIAAVVKEAHRTVIPLALPRAGRGAPFIHTVRRPRFRPDWYIDPRLAGVCNHETRGHIEADLQRYLFASCFAQAHGRSPSLKDFPDVLLPHHKNVRKALNGNLFADRFRVQVKGRPSTTITSHISKDGHYFIHYDPRQCRSLTVREAARLQTFPDNYFFEGPRTEQYVQVGNAVPPLIAQQIAEVVLGVLQPLPANVSTGNSFTGRRAHRTTRRAQ